MNTYALNEAVFHTLDNSAANYKQIEALNSSLGKMFDLLLSSGCNFKVMLWAINTIELHDERHLSHRYVQVSSGPCQIHMMALIGLTIMFH